MGVLLPPGKAELDLPPEWITSRFHRLVYEAGSKGVSWGGATYMGTKMWKWPCDLQLYQELVWDLKPWLIIETGTAFGGSALYFAHLLDALGHGKVVSVDVTEVQQSWPKHPRIAYISGKSSVDPNTLAEVRSYYNWHSERHTGSHPNTLVILDSDHKKEHVLAELEAYSRFVNPGSWLVVEDTNVNGHPVYPEHGPGPQEALDVWLPKHEDYKVDEARAAKYLFSMHTWLRRRRV